MKAIASFAAQDLISKQLPTGSANYGASQYQQDVAQLNFQGQSALEIWSKYEVTTLWNHLHNDNGPFDYVMGFQDRETGKKRYARSKKVPSARAISWAIETVHKRKVPEKSLAFVPYSTNSQQMSRWGGFDFDAHGGETDRARRLAFSAWQLLLNFEFATILESSGSGGWHVWAVSCDFKPVSHWIRLLKSIARDIGAPIQSGLCEIFPPDTISRGFGKGMRAPGAWNPGTNTLSEIYWQNAHDLISRLPRFVMGKSRRIEEVESSHSDVSPIEKEDAPLPPSLSALEKIISGAETYRIRSSATRHQQLEKLVGASFQQVSRSVASQLARAQYVEKTVSTRATEAEHIEEFDALWKGMESRWVSSLDAAEREGLAILSTEAEQGAFRIIRSYAQKAAADGLTDFPIVRDNLGKRIGITGEGAGHLRKKFVRIGLIEQTAPYRACVSAARYRWTANVSQPF